MISISRVTRKSSVVSDQPCQVTNTVSGVRSPASDGARADGSAPRTRSTSAASWSGPPEASSFASSRTEVLGSSSSPEVTQSARR